MSKNLKKQIMAAKQEAETNIIAMLRQFITEEHVAINVNMDDALENVVVAIETNINSGEGISDRNVFVFNRRIQDNKINEIINTKGTRVMFDPKNNEIITVFSIPSEMSMSFINLVFEVINSVVPVEVEVEESEVPVEQVTE